MSKLTELYAKRKVFEDYGAPIPEALNSEIREAERSIFANINNSIVNVVPTELDIQDIKGKVVVALEYVDGSLTRLGSAQETNDVFSWLDMDVLPIEIEDEYPDDEGPEFTRSKSIPFSVTFPDGTVIHSNTAQQTLIDSLKYMGLERVSNFTGETFKGYPLVGKRKRVTPDGMKWQEEVAGWWVYVNMTNARKIRCIEGVASMLGIQVIINHIDKNYD